MVDKMKKSAPAAATAEGARNDQAEVGAQPSTNRRGVKLRQRFKTFDLAVLLCLSRRLTDDELIRLAVGRPRRNAKRRARKIATLAKVRSKSPPQIPKAPRAAPGTGWWRQWERDAVRRAERAWRAEQRRLRKGRSG